jgi:hypothetical protein
LRPPRALVSYAAMKSNFPAASATTDALLAEADRHYLAREWADALALYDQVGARDPTRTGELALPIGIGHCRIELADADGLATLASDPCPESVRSTVFSTTARHRALELCSAGDVVRAARLLRFLGGFDGALSHTYAESIDRGRTTWADRLGRPESDIEPGFLADTGLSDDVVAAAKQRHRGRRILLAGPIYPTRQYEAMDNLARSGARFGLVVQRFDTHDPKRDPDLYAGALLAAILAFKPDVLYYTDLFEFDAAAHSPVHAEQIVEVLNTVRQTLGVRVIRHLTDAWRAAARVGGDLFVGFGSFVDLLHHEAPCVRGLGTATQRSITFCYPTPCHLAVSTVAQGAIPRGCFVGRIHEWAYTRGVWWIECASRGLPIDFKVQLPWDTAQVIDPPASDQDYADALRGYAVSINFTSRLNGVKIFTQRSLETMLCGGALLEEASPDTGYFLKPGRHYAAFETLADLAATLPALIADRPRRLALADEGQRWVAKYFDGAYLWAGLLDRLAALG